MSQSERFESLHVAIDHWCDDGGQWLNCADRVLADSHRFLKELEEKDHSLRQRETALEGWQRNLEQREAMLVERERLLTEGLLQFSNPTQPASIVPAQDAPQDLGGLLDELFELRDALKQSLASSPSNQKSTKEANRNGNGSKENRAEKATHHNASSHHCANAGSRSRNRKRR